MGSGKKRLKARRKKKSIQRREVRKEMGKPVFFTLMHCPHVMKGFSNRYNYKATLYKVSYKRARFENVKWQSSNITSCSFSGAHLVGVDFYNSNLKNTSFKNAHLEHVVFFNCNLRNANFSGTTFDHVTFISTNINVADNIVTDDSCTIYRTYPKLLISPDVETGLLELAQFSKIYLSHVLHVSKHKLNLWTLKLLFDIYGDSTYRALLAISRKADKRGFCTVYAYKKHIEKYLRL